MKRSRDKMAPLDENFNDDATFQTLLLSQRELLNNIKRQTMMASSKPMLNPLDAGGISMNSSNLAIGADPHFNNVVLSKCTSGDLGEDSFAWPDLKFHSVSQHSDSFPREKIHGHRTRKFEDGTYAGGAKRRRSADFLREIFENSEADGDHDSISNGSIEFSSSSDDDDYGVIVEDVPDDNTSESVPAKRTNVRQHMVDFEKAMEKSQVSQQKIHDWDRKMGLKRSHSKTMRLSSRSRKKLRHQMKKDITQLSKLP